MKFALALATVSLAPLALAGDGDYYLSSPATGTIWRGNQKGGGGEAFASGVLIPHYGHFAPDGTFYVPDRGWPALLKISPTGVVSALSAGGVFDKPVTCIPSLDGQALGGVAGERVGVTDVAGLEVAAVELHSGAAVG